MRNDNKLKQCLSDALVTFDKFNEYCEDYGLQLYELKVCIRGFYKLMNLNENNINNIVWVSKGEINRVLIKFKCNRKNSLKLTYEYGAYQVPLTSFRLKFLKTTIKDEYLKDIKYWANRNNVFFHIYSNKGIDQEYTCTVTKSRENESRGVAIGRIGHKFKVKKWHLRYVGMEDKDEINEFNSLEEVIAYLDSWIKSLNDTGDTLVGSNVKAFSYKNNIIVASCRGEAIKKIISENDSV